MTPHCPQVYWHWAVSPIHQKIAAASFLQAATDAGLTVLYAPTDASAPLLEDAAAQIGVTLYPTLLVETPRTTHTSGYAWIGSHDPNEPERCTQLAEHANPPRIILCLEKGSDTPPDIPEDHATYVTGLLSNVMP